MIPKIQPLEYCPTPSPVLASSISTSPTATFILSSSGPKASSPSVFACGKNTGNQLLTLHPSSSLAVEEQESAATTASAAGGKKKLKFIWIWPENPFFINTFLSLYSRIRLMIS